MNSNLICFALLSTVLTGNALATSVDKAIAIQGQTNQASAASQKRIDASSDRTLELRAEIEQLRQEVHNYEVYRDHLSALIRSQEQEMDSFNRQIDNIKFTRQGIVPLMYRMLDGLKTTVENDRPLKKDKRMERLEKLQDLMVRADVSDAEKYRRILEAFQIEVDYGTKMGRYQGTLLTDDSEVQADILYVGRISLVARNLNKSQYWAWDDSQRNWQKLDSEMKPDIDKAFSIAGKDLPPDLLYLPVSLRESEK